MLQPDGLAANEEFSAKRMMIRRMGAFLQQSQSAETRNCSMLRYGEDDSTEHVVIRCKSVTIWNAGLVAGRTQRTTPEELILVQELPHLACARLCFSDLRQKACRCAVSGTSGLLLGLDSGPQRKRSPTQMVHIPFRHGAARRELLP
jgi:hypothetical protein